MDGDFAHDSASNPEPLPPARTRWAEEAGAGPGAGSLLGPVRSGRLESGAAEPFVAPEIVPPETHLDQSEVEAQAREETAREPHIASDAGWTGLAPETLPSAEPEEAEPEEAGPEEAELATPELEEARLQEAEPETAEAGADFELTLETGDVELIMESEEPLPLVEETVEAAPEAEPAESHEEKGPVPISAWDLSPRPTNAAEKVRRAHEEWASLEQTLVHSLGGTAGEGTGAGVPSELEDLARRLEQFAAALRTDGTKAMEMAHRRGDPIDVVLAAIAAGYVSGRRE